MGIKDKSRIVHYSFHAKSLDDGDYIIDCEEVLAKAKAQGIICNYDDGRNRDPWFEGTPGKEIRALRDFFLNAKRDYYGEEEPQHMTIPKKGSRVIRFDDKDYRYVVKRYLEGLRVTVQEAIAQPGRVLQFSWPEGHELRPSDVLRGIEDALKQGWNPSQKGPVFRLPEPTDDSV